MGTATQRSDGGRTARIALALSIVSVVAAVVSTFIAFSAWNPRARLEPIEPSSYAIVRGMPERAPADFLILPLEWENDRGGTQIIRKPYLTLSVLDEEGTATGEEHEFVMVGEYPAISYEAISEPYSFGNTILLEPHSVASNVVVFAPLKWWDRTHPDHEFRFRAGSAYELEVNYLLNSGGDEGKRTLLRKLEIYGSADELVPYGEGGLWWDHWYL